MKILIIHPYSFSEYKGGVERYCQNLAQAFSNEKEIKISQVTGHCFKFLGEPLPTLNLFRIIKKENPDIFHLHGPRPFATICAIFGKILKKKMVLTYYAHLHPQGFLKKIIAKLDLTLAKYLFDFLTVISEKYRDDLIKSFSSEKIRIIPLLLEDKFFQFQKDKEECRAELSLGKGKIVLFVGKLDSHHYYKGVDILMAAAKLMPGEVKFIIVGDGDRKKDYEEKVLESGLGEKIEFRGNVSEVDLMRFYRAADIFVLPSTSDSEGFGFVLLEAMAMGLPVITTEVVGSAKIIEENQAGIIIPANSPSSLSDAIQKLAKDELLRQTLVRNGRILAEEFRMEKNIHKFLEIYQQLIK